ncbi:MAG: serine hydrolase domain-containing protein [Bacteroidota bacterium]
MNKIYLLLLAALLSSCADKPHMVDSYLGPDIPKSTIDRHVQEQMKDLKIPGLAIAIINDGEIRYHNTFGYADVAAEEPVNSQTIFEGASISKSVFAFLVMTFVEAGKLDLDKPLYEYVPHPDLADDPRSQQITARMVLSHRSGLPNWRENEEDKTLKIKFEPGTDYLYSGEGFQYLAEVLMHIEHTDHAGLEQLFQERIAKPLGLDHTVFIQTPYTRHHKAEPYDREANWIDWHTNYWFQKEDSQFYAPSSIHSEPVDFSKWMIALMKQELLSPDSYRELLKRHSRVPFEGVDVSYTLGYLTPHFPFTDIYLHSGSNEGFTSWYALDINRDWGFIMFANSDNGEQLGQELFFYLMTGPDLTPIYIMAGAVALILLLLIVGGIWYLVRRRKKRKKAMNAG